jgi:hypothetical protein
MNQITDYQIVVAGSSGALTTIVKNELKQGWSPLGAPFASCGEARNPVFRQAMIKTKGIWSD